MPFEGYNIMRMSEKENKINFRKKEWANLFLRVSVGGSLLLHNVAKMQDYNFIITSYQSYWGMAGATWFVILSSIEVTCAFMLIMGYRVKLASATLIVGTIMALMIYFKDSSATFLNLQILYVFIYIYFLISGGGLYSFDYARARRLE